MFLKNKASASGITAVKKDSIPSVIARDLNILGNIVSDGVVDFDGRLDGNIRCHTLSVRQHAVINGEVMADNLLVYGKIKGVIRARNVSLFASCRIEGIIMHESISIEDGAFIDGKCKRTDKIEDEDEEYGAESGGSVKMLENIRLIG